MSATPVLDGRRAEAVLRQLLRRVPSFLPGWKPSFPGPGGALLQVVSRYAEVLVQRLDQAPDKNKLAFLDMLGIELLPPQAARAPVAFVGIPNLADGRIPERTRVGARVPGRSEPLVFETERAIALASARLAEVVCVSPADDAYSDHTVDALAPRPFTLFRNLQPIPHALYVAHDTLFDFNGSTTLEVHLTLATTAGSALPCVWEYWDGKTWRSFTGFDTDDADASHDGTRGFTRSGVVRLNAACGRAQPVAVNGREAFWLRARPADPLPPLPGRVLPEIDAVQLRAIVKRPLQHLVTPQGKVCLGGVEGDNAFAGTARLDLSQTFYPFGRVPSPDSAFYIASEEVLGKPGADVSVCFTRVPTAEEEADALEAAQREKEAVAGIRNGAADAAGVAVSISQVVSCLLDGAHPLHAARQQLASAAQDVAQTGDLDGLAQRLALVAALMAGGVADAPDIVDDLGLSELADRFHIGLEALTAATGGVADLLDSLASLGPLMAAPAAAARLVMSARAAADVSLAAVASALEDEDGWSFFQLFDSDQVQPLLDALHALQTARQDIDEVTEIASVRDAARAVADQMASLEELDFSLFMWWVEDELRQVLVRMAKAALKGTGSASIVLDHLRAILGLEGAGTVDANAPELSPPRVAWEYWNGSRWRRLMGQSGDPGANFITSGEVQFTVPDDLAAATVNGVEARWIRVRITHGAFARIRMVRWSDTVTGTSNLMSVIEPRPPALAQIFFGYVYRSPTLPPEHCVTHNDFRFEDHTRDARWPGPAFAPFRSTADLTPTLYLGFDRPLPADLVSLYLGVTEQEDRPQGPELAWEGWNGAAWTSLEAEDDTRGLAVPGIVAAVWPGVPGPPPSALVQAASASTSIRLLEPREAARFRQGDRVSLRQQDASELAVVSAAAGGVLTLASPLAGDYAQGTVEPATQPRFGTQRTWLRCRYAGDGPAVKVRIEGIYPNAVWAAQRETIENETLGSTDGEPSQAFFVRHTPVLDEEVLEVRELQGPRAAVELPLLRSELARRGLPETDLRTVNDPRTGKVKEAWVRWRTKPHLFFSGPDDRHALLERAAGRLVFGDGDSGQVPPPGADSVRLARYRTGGGLAGNVAAGAITQVLSGVAVQGVANPGAAEGGSDGEPAAEVLVRGPEVMRHWHQALSAADYEAMAREASPAVAVARALPLTDAAGRPEAGWVRLLIVPQSQDPRPRPSFELRRRVEDYIRRRGPATLAGLTVAGPEYLPVGVSARVSALHADEAGPVRDRVLAALREFLHPLRGGPERRGWPFGRDVHLSDLAAIVERLRGVDHASTLQLLRDGTPRGTVLRVRADRIVVAGELEVTVSVGEG